MKVLHMCTIYNISISINMLKSTGILDLYAYKIYMFVYSKISSLLVPSYSEHHHLFPGFLFLPLSWFPRLCSCFLQLVFNVGHDACLCMNLQWFSISFTENAFFCPQDLIILNISILSPSSHTIATSAFWTHHTLRSIKQ